MSELIERNETLVIVSGLAVIEERCDVVRLEPGLLRAQDDFVAAAGEARRVGIFRNGGNGTLPVQTLLPDQSSILDFDARCVIYGRAKIHPNAWQLAEEVAIDFRASRMIAIDFHHDVQIAAVFRAACIGTEHPERLDFHLNLEHARGRIGFERDGVNRSRVEQRAYLFELPGEVSAWLADLEGGVPGLL